MGGLPCGDSRTHATPSSISRAAGVQCMGKEDGHYLWQNSAGLEGMFTSAHSHWLELSHMATLMAKEAGKGSTTVCPGRKSESFR